MLNMAIHTLKQLLSNSKISIRYSGDSISGMYNNYANILRKPITINDRDDTQLDMIIDDQQDINNGVGIFAQ